MPKVKIVDINIYYEIHGKGEPLVLNSGGGGSIESQVQRIKVFSPEYQIVAYESRGAGRSDAPDIPYTMEMYADDLAGLLDVLGIDSAHIFGESFGGIVAQYFTLGYPERVRSLILASTVCGGQYTVMPSAEAMKIITTSPKMPPEERASEILRLFMTREYAEKNPDIMQHMMGRMVEYSAPSGRAIRWQQASMAADTCERLPEIKAPTLVVHGEADKALPVENSRILASRIPNAELVIFPNAGHLLIEAWEEYCKVMLDFLKRHSHQEKE